MSAVAGGLEQAGRRVRGPYRNGVERRRQLVDAAWSIFARRGYATASLREIADAVGVSPAGILRLFGSKEALLIAVLDRWRDETEALAAAVDLGKGRGYFDSFGNLMRYHVEHPGLIELFLTLCTESTDPEHPARAWVASRYADIVAVAAEQLALVQEGAGIVVTPATEREVEVRVLFAAMDGLELQWIADPDLDLVGLTDGLFSTTMARWTHRDVPLEGVGWPPPARVGRLDVGVQPRDSPVVGAPVRGPYRTGVERRRQIVAEATKVFGNRGYAGASLREIGRNVGVTAAALLRFFGSKEQLLFAVLDYWDDESECRTTWQDTGDGMAYFEALTRVMGRHREKPGLVELLLRLCAEASDPAHPARDWVAGRYRLIVADGGRALEAAVHAGALPAMDGDRAEMEIRILFAVMDGLELQWFADSRLDLAGIFRHVFGHTLERWRGPVRRGQAR